jgi:hypothetical protein
LCKFFVTPYQLAGGDRIQARKACLKWVLWGYEKMLPGDIDSLNQSYVCYIIEHMTKAWEVSGYVPMTHIEWPQEVEQQFGGSGGD